MKSLRAKLWMGMMSLIFIMLVLLWFFQVVFLESIYTSMHVSEIKRGARLLTESYYNAGNDYEENLEAFAFRNNLYLEIFDPQGSIMFQSGENPMMMPMMNNIRNAAFQKAISGEEESIHVTHPRFGNKILLISLPVKESESIKGVFMVSMSMAPVKETAGILKRQLFYITLILLAMTLVISFFFIQKPFRSYYGYKESL